MNQVLAIVVAALFMLGGLVGTILPVLPGVPLIWLGMLLYGLITGFEQITAIFLILQALLAAFVMGIDYLAAVFGSRYFGGSKAASWRAISGSILGLIFLSLPGLLAGPFIGAALAELLFTKQPQQALRAGLGATIGSLGGIPIKLAIELAMIAWFVIQIS